MNRAAYISAGEIVADLNRDTAAIGTLFEFYKPRLYAHALRICGNTCNAQDALQDTFIAAFTHLNSLRQPKLFYPWLKRILINNCYQLLRKEKFTPLDERGMPNDLCVRENIDTHFENISNQQSIFEALRHLSDELRSCVMLRYFSSFNNYTDIASLLHIPVGTVRSRLSAAREKLAQLYCRYDDAGAKTLQQAKQWSAYYQLLWTRVYDDATIRNELFNHLHPMINIRFTSGKTARGRNIIEKEVNDDLQFGTRFNATMITSCGDISLVEGVNSNTKEFPDRCPPSSVFVLIRKNERVDSFHLFDAHRK